MQRNRPSYGLVFSQLVELHLLCTRVPKTRVDVEVMNSGLGGRRRRTGGGDAVGFGEDVACEWVVEVLGDEVGVFEGGDEEGGLKWRKREQRWGVVDVGA